MLTIWIELTIQFSENSRIQESKTENPWNYRTKLGDLWIRDASQETVKPRDVLNVVPQPEEDLWVQRCISEICKPQDLNQIFKPESPSQDLEWSNLESLTPGDPRTKVLRFASPWIQRFSLVCIRQFRMINQHLMLKLSPLFSDRFNLSPKARVT